MLFSASAPNTGLTQFLFAEILLNMNMETYPKVASQDGTGMGERLISLPSYST